MTTPPDASVPPRLRLPVTVVLERREIRRGRWASHSWYLSGALVGEGFGRERADGLEVRAGDPRAPGPAVPGQGADAGSDAGPGAGPAPALEYAWTGRVVTLYRDACERYWHALIGERPLVYAVCREREAAPGIEPFLVTIDYDEASAFGETDALVLSTDIAPAMYRYMEGFVLAHYRPKPFEKRRRKRWARGEGDATPTLPVADGEGRAAAAADAGTGPAAGPPR